MLPTKNKFRNIIGLGIKLYSKKITSIIELRI